MRPLDPWTYDDFELNELESWEIYDPNEARIVAVFYDRQQAEEYLRWRNKKQEKARRRKEKRRRKRIEDGGYDWGFGWRKANG